MNRKQIQQKIEALTVERDQEMRTWERLVKKPDNIWNRRKQELSKRRIHELNGQKVAWEARLEHATDDSGFVIFIKKNWFLILVVLGLLIYKLFFF